MKAHRPDPWKPGKPPRPLRRALREFSLLLFFALLAAAPAVHGFRRELLEERLKEALIVALRDRAGIEAQIETIEGTWLDSVVLTGVVLRGSDRRPELLEARIERAEARFDPVRLARGDVSGLRGIAIEGVRLSLDLGARPSPPPGSGSPAVPPAAPVPDPAAVPPAPPSRPFHEILFPPIEVRGLTLELRGDGFALSAWNAGVDSPGTVAGATDGLVAWEGWRLTAGERTFEGGQAFLRVRKEGPGFRLAWMEEDGSRVLRAAVSLPPVWAGGTLAVSLVAEAWPLGPLRAKGRLRLPPAEGFSVDGDLRGTDLGALARAVGGLPLEPRGSLRLDFRAEGESFDPARIKGSVKATLEGGGWAGGPSVDALDADLRLEPGLDFSIAGKFRWPGGKAEGSARGGPDAPCAVSASVCASDLGPLDGGLAGISADLSVAAEGRITGEWPRPGFRGSARIQGPDASGVRNVLVEAAGEASQEGFDLTRVRAVCAGGAVLGSLRGRFPPWKSLEGKVLVNVADAALCIPGFLASRLPVRGALKGSGKASRSDGAWSATGELRAEGASFGPLDADLVHLAFALGPGSVEAYDFRLERAEGKLEVPYLEVSFGDGVVRGKLPYVEVAVGDEALTSSGPIAFAVGENVFRLTGAELRGDWARIALEGEMTEDGRIAGRLSAEDVLVDRAARLLGLPPAVRGKATLKLTLEGTAADPRFEGGLLASGVVGAGGLPPADLLAGLRYAGGRLELFEGEANSDAFRAAFRAVLPLPLGGPGGADAGRIRDAWFESPDLGLDLEVRDLQAGLFPWKGPAPEGTLSARLRVRGPLTAPEISASASGEGLVWEGLPASRAAVSLRTEDGGIRLETGACRLETELGFAEISGWVPFRAAAFRSADGTWAFDPFSGEGRFDLWGRTGPVEVRRVLERIGAPGRFREIEGLASLRSIHAGGTWADPTIEASGRVERIWNEAFVKPGKAAFKVEIGGGWASLSSLEAELAGGWLDAEARVPLRLDLEALQGKVPVLAEGAQVEGEWEARGVGLESVALYVPGLERCAGRLDAKGTLSGPWNRIDLGVEAQVSDGSLTLQNSDLPKLGSLSGRVAIEDRVLTLRATAESGGGRMSANGQASLDDWYVPRRFEVGLEGRDRPIVLSGPPFRARADFRLTLAGTPWDATLRGLVNVQYTEVERRFDLGGPASGAPGLVPGFAVPLIDHVRMDLTIVTPEGIRLVSEVHRRGIPLADLDVRFRGNLQVQGDTRAPVLIGNVYTEAGEVRLPFYTLTLVSGDVNFLEGNPHNPRLRVVAKTVKGDTSVFVTVNGSLVTPDVGFFSEPPMPEADIKTFLATGVRPEAWHGDRAGETLGVQLAALLVKQVSPYVFGRGGNAAVGFLDRLSFGNERSELRDATTWRAEFRFLDWLWLVGEKDEWEHYNLKLRGKFGFKTR